MGYPAQTIDGETVIIESKQGGTNGTRQIELLTATDGRQFVAEDGSILLTPYVEATETVIDEADEDEAPEAPAVDEAQLDLDADEDE